MLDVCTIEDLVICGTFELLTIHVWLIWAMTCIIMLDVHACMSERNTHTHTDIYIYIYIMTCIALHDFTIFYTYLSLYIYIFYIHLLYVIHNKYRSSAPASAVGLGAKHCTPSQRCRWWHQLLGISVFFWEIMGIFYGNIYICIYVLCIWLCIYVYMYYEMII